MEAWRLIQNNAIEDHNESIAAFKRILIAIAVNYGCTWQQLGGKRFYDRMTPCEQVIHRIAMQRIEAGF